MPSVAYDIDNKELEFAARADQEYQYVCPECKQNVAFISQHKRGKEDTTVRSHFRYDNCNHRGIVVNPDGIGGGGGGGGESEKHKRRKYDAMQKALTVFPEADYALEEDIGSKRPDAKIIFNEPHSKYGKGLAIEYQHKNESKDRKATEQTFAVNEFTTIWLWDEQFDYSGPQPDIDLYGGEVYTPWPDAVPRYAQWNSETHESYLAGPKFEYEPKGDPSPILPPKFAMQFLDVNMLIRNSPGTHEHLLEEFRENQPQLPSVTFVKEAEKWIYKREFQGEIRKLVSEFENRMQSGFGYKSEEYIQEVRNSLKSGQLKMRIGPWIEILLKRKIGVAYGENAVMAKCDSCGNKRLIDPWMGEKKRTFKCSDCDEWTVVIDVDTNTNKLLS